MTGEHVPRSPPHPHPLLSQAPGHREAHEQPALPLGSSQSTEGNRQTENKRTRAIQGAVMGEMKWGVSGEIHYC